MIGRTLQDGSVTLYVAWIIVALGLGLGKVAQAQSTPGETEDTYLAVVTEDEVLIRSGAHHNYYPFGVLRAGSQLLVLGEKDRWARVKTVGPAFDELYGYVRYRADDAGRIRMAPDEKSAVALGRIDVLAPNLNSDADPTESWKAVARLEPNDRMKVIGTVQVGRDVFMKVGLPEKAVGWVNLSHLRRATATETRQWEALVFAQEEGRRPGVTRTERAEPAERPSVSSVLAREEAQAPVVTPPVTLERPGTAAAAVPVTPVPDQTPAVTTPRAAEQAVPPAAQAEVQPEVMTPVTPPEPAAPVRPARVSSRSDAVLMLEDLEAAYERLRQEPIESAEVNPLRELYLDLADRTAEQSGVARYAKARAEQLQIWAELQDRRLELGRLRNRIEAAGAETAAALQAIESRREYVAVGRLSASSIYDGQQLPMLLRLRDPGTGRTLAYLKVGEPDRHNLLGRLGQLVGIVGVKEYDGGLRLNLISPARVDVLSPKEGQPDPA